MLISFSYLNGIVIRIAAWAGIDTPVANVLLARVWSLFSGPISIFLIATIMSPEQQGYFYTFANVLALKVFAELGLRYVVLQFASHEIVGCEWRNGIIVGPVERISRLRDLFRKAVWWYAGVSAFLIMAVLPGGWLFFSANHEPGVLDPSEWQGAWVALVALNSIAVITIPASAIIEGCGKVAEVTRNRMHEAMGLAAFLWVALICGAGLYAPAISCFGGLLVVLVWLSTTKHRLLRQLWTSDQNHQINWKSEVLPLQWRTAVSWISGYFSYMMFTPFVFAYKGPDAAGQMGMTLKMVEMITFVAGAWLQTKSAPFGRFVAERAWHTLDRMYSTAVVRSFVVYGLGSLGFILLIEVLRMADVAIAGRFLSATEVCVLLAMWGMNHVLFTRAIYLRAYKQEPFYWIHFGAGLVTVAALSLLLPQHGILPVLLIIGLVANLPAMILSGKIMSLCRAALQMP